MGLRHGMKMISVLLMILTLATYGQRPVVCRKTHVLRYIRAT